MKNKLLAVTLIASCSLMCACGKKEEPKSNLPTSMDTGNFDIVMESVNTVPEEVGATDGEKNALVLDINGQEFYSVYIPAGIGYATDYSKYVYGEDPKFTISVLSGVSDSNFGSSVGVVNAESVAQNIVRSKPGQKGPQQCAVLLSGNRAVVANCYNCPEVFATILEGMTNHTEAYTVSGVQYVEDVVNLETLQYNGSLEATAIDKTQVGKTCLYKYDDGGMYVSTELRQFEDAKNFLLTKLNVVSGQSVSETYANGNVYYAKAGNFHLVLFQENFNTTTVLFGNGDESLCNMVFLLSQMTDK